MWLPLGIPVHASSAIVGDVGRAAWSVPKLRANFTTRRFLKKALSLDEDYRIRPEIRNQKSEIRGEGVGAA
jgi:hypothetical protein